MDILAGALEVDGALPALKILEVNFPSTPHVLAKLAEALVGGTLPLLEHLELHQNDDLTDEDRVLVANMVERRAQIPGCHGLTDFRSNNYWLGEGTPGEFRLLRALLPSLVTFAGDFQWHAALDSCFRDICPPNLEVLKVGVSNEAFPSLRVFEAAPAL